MGSNPAAPTNFKVALKEVKLPLSLSEQLLYSTVKLIAFKEGKELGSGTGFFMRLAEGSDQEALTIITNKHVIEGADYIAANYHLADGDEPSGQFTEAKFPIMLGSYVLHPDSDVDLCAILVSYGLFFRLKPLFTKTYSLSIVPEDKEWESFDAIEDVTMVGCPRGIYDEVNGLPLIRQGITATSLTKSYNGKNEFMVDMACFPGSSGSPILIYNRNGYVDGRSGNYIASGRLRLVGILRAGPEIDNEGEIVFGHTPTVRVATMMHLGIAIKSNELRVLDDQVRNHWSNLTK